MLRPVLTEKSLNLAKSQNKYTFLVDKGLRKHQIQQLVKKVFGVDVLNVATARIKGRRKWNLRTKSVIKKPDMKKAIVALPENQRIELFEADDSGKEKKG